MTTDTWNSSTSTVWGNSAGWSEGAIPGTGEDVVINPGVTTAITLEFIGLGSTGKLDVLTMGTAAANVTLLEDSTSASSINLNNGPTSGVHLTAGTISIHGTFTGTKLSGFDEINANVVNIDGPSAQVDLGVYGFLDVLDSLTMSQGGITLAPAAGTVPSGGELAIGAFGPSDTLLTNVYYGDVMIVGSGTLAVSGGTISATNFYADSGSFTQSGGSIVATKTGTFVAGTDSINGGLFEAGTVFVGDSLSMGGGTLAGVAGGVVNTGTFIGSSTIIGHGTIVGHGTIEGVISGTGGSIVATGGVLEITSNLNAASNFLHIGAAAASVLKFDGSETSGNTITFDSKTAGALELNGTTAIGGVTDTVTNFGTAATNASVIGDNFINVQGVTIGTVVVDGLGGRTFDGAHNVIDIENSSNAIIGKITLASAPAAGISVLFGADTVLGGGIGSGTDIFLASIVCFVEGTLIQTDHGEVPVEALREGDRVIARRDGEPAPMPIKWMGLRTVNVATHPYPHTVAPVRIRAGAFGDNLPRRDLLVSPAHAIFVDGKLVPANLLINNMTIVQELQTRLVTYHHVELEQHSLLLSEGLESESYLDTGNRAFFTNAGPAMVLHPEFHVNAGLTVWDEKACAPLVVDAESIAPLWRALADRAEMLGYVPPRFTTTMDADLYLEADGRRLRPVAVAKGRHTFMLPAGAADIVLRSRTSAPADLDPLSGDWRALGVAVRSMTLRSGEDHIVIPADHPGLTDGWFASETNDGAIWRWTTGRAVIPVQGNARPTMLDVEIGSTATYILTRSDRDAQRLAA